MKEELSSADKIRFFVYPSGHFEAAEAGDKALEESFGDILQHVGRKEPRGEVGIRGQSPVYVKRTKSHYKEM